VRFVVAYSVGLGRDIVARTLAAHCSERWGQPVVVDNRPGAPSAEMRPWAARVAPAHAPVAARERIDHDVRVALADEIVRKRIEGAGFAVTPSTARELAALIDADRVR
jgi:tripartite-type tricarboxylate transporter receptor subunit TctC